MRGRRRITVLGSIVIGLVAVAVSVFVGGGWAIILLELAGVGLLLFFFWRDQRVENTSESAEEQ